MKTEEWISVDEDIPHEGQWVLCKTKDNLYGGMVVQSWEAWTNHGELWFRNNFTHWQPLPSPPKD